MKEDVIIESERLYLKKISNEVLDDMCVLANDEEVARYLLQVFPFPYSRKDGIFYLKLSDDRWKSGEGYDFAIFIKEGDKYIGNISISKRHDDVWGFGYWIGKKFWRNGYATEAVRVLVSYLFDNSIVRKLSAGIFSPNKASENVLKKNGFEVEGLLKEERYLRDGKVIDDITMGLINKNFKK